MQYIFLIIRRCKKKSTISNGDQLHNEQPFLRLLSQFAYLGMQNDIITRLVRSIFLETTFLDLPPNSNVPCSSLRQQIFQVLNFINYSACRSQQLQQPSIRSHLDEWMLIDVKRNKLDIFVLNCLWSTPTDSAWKSRKNENECRAMNERSAEKTDHISVL